MGREKKWSEYVGYDVGENPRVLIMSREESEALASLLDLIINDTAERTFDGVEIDPLLRCHLELLNGWLRELRCWLRLDSRH